MEEYAGIPDPEPLPNDDCPVHYSFIADDAFGLRPWLMKPHPSRRLTKQKRIFNYRLSRACRVVENAFGILAQRYLLIIIFFHITNIYLVLVLYSLPVLMFFAILEIMLIIPMLFCITDSDV